MPSRALLCLAIAAALCGAPSSTSAVEPKGSIPTQEAGGPVDLVLAVVGIVALGLFAWSVLLTGRRRRATHGIQIVDHGRRSSRGSTEEQVSAALHRRTLRRSKIRPDEDPIVASMGIRAAKAEQALHRARPTRRSPPT